MRIQSSQSSETPRITPFLMWAGGKRWLMSNHIDLFPATYSRFVEPFVGSGAVYFSLLPEQALLSDANIELINTYTAIKQDYRLVERYLKSHANAHSDEYFYLVRNQKPKSIFKQAARLIYLNRTCWNALYRVNKNGDFNVPRGTKDSVLLDTDNFERVSQCLQKAHLISSDFEGVIDSTKSGDFLFVDPPYTVKHNHNGFVKYNKELFSWEDQKRLKCSIERANARGVSFLMTNANHESIRSLYGNEFNTHTLTRHSVIAADSLKREKTTEFLVCNY